jgi:hypothetical protein
MILNACILCPVPGVIQSEGAKSGDDHEKDCMKKIGLLAIALTGLALSACAPRYYDRDGYHRDGYRDRYAPAGGVYYSDRDRYNDRYYSDYPNREYRDRRSRYDRDED